MELDEGSEMTYAIGEEVICIVNLTSLTYLKKGKVIDTDNLGDAMYIAIEFYENIQGHSCNGEGKAGHCYWANGRNVANAKEFLQLQLEGKIK